VTSCAIGPSLLGVSLRSIIVIRENILIPIIQLSIFCLAAAALVAAAFDFEFVLVLVRVLQYSAATPQVNSSGRLERGGA